MKHVKFHMFFFVLLSFSTNAFGQFPDVAKAFGNYKTKYPASRLHLVFNQPFYAPGDTIFFSAWHLDEAQKLFRGRQVGSLDLVGADAQPVTRIHFKIEDGRSVNQIALPKDLQPGSYTLVAYTNWMRNFSNDWFYRKRIEIKGRNEIIGAQISLTAGVEGGNLVAGIVNHIVVAAGQPGATVTIRNLSNEEIASASTDSTGIASINITPRANEQYSVIGPNSSKAQLPPVKQNGVVVKLSGESFTLTSAGQYKDKDLLGVFTSQGKVVETRRVKFIDGNATVAMPGILNGLYHQLYVIDQVGTVVAERVFAVDNSTDNTGTVTGTLDVSQRQNVTMTIELPTAADISITAYQQKLFDKNMLEQSFDLSELPDVLAWAETFSRYDQSLNTFLATQHWTRINWSEILSGESKKMQFPNYSILTGKGKVLSRTTGEPAPDSTNVIVYLQKNTMGYDTYTRGGRFEIPFSFDFWGNDHLFVALQHKSRDLDADFEVVFEEDSISLPSTAPARQSRTESVYGNYVSNKQLISTSYSYFVNTSGNNDSIRSLNALFEDELGQIDAEVNVEKYVVFPAMEDLLREVVPFVQYRKTGMAKGVRMMLRYPTGNRASKGNPLFIVDGVMTRDLNFFMRLEPKDILTVKVVNDPKRLMQLGRIGENGILLVESKRGTLADSLRNVSNLQVTGLNPTIPFRYVKQAQSVASQRVPDLRSTLFWQPKASTDSSGKVELSFVTSDDVGPVKVIVQGLTSEGVPIFLEKEVNVKFQKQP